MSLIRSLTTGALAVASAAAFAAPSAAAVPGPGAPAPSPKLGRHLVSSRAYAPSPPLKLAVVTPAAGGRAGAGGSFNVDLMLQARTRRANSLLSAAQGYKPFFNDPSAATFGPGQADPGAPGLVVLLSSTPTKAGTPLQGPDTNLAGVFQLNTVASVAGLNQTWNAWQVTSPGFFGTGRVTLTAYAVAGTAPGRVTTPGAGAISNVVRLPFTIGG
jgi:hypothetical protein